MGEAAAKLRLIFDNIQNVRGVYLFDEFDAIGQQRATANDIGEIRRILNSFLQLVEQDQSTSVIVAATNHPQLLDNALFRRFDDVLRFEMPSISAIIELIERRLRAHVKDIQLASVAEAANGLSFADIQRAVDDSIKEMIIAGHSHIDEPCLLRAIQERKSDQHSFSNSI